MQREIRAVIDVGTTSVKLLVAEVKGRSVTPLFSGTEVTRLGQGLHQTCALSPTALVRTSQVVAEFKRQAARFKPRWTRVLGTSAAREAANQKDLVKAIWQASGLHIEVVSGEQEAELIFRGVTTDSELAHKPLIVFDLGGGSTEVAVGEGPFVYCLRSFPIGTLRLLELVQPKDPPSPNDRLRCLARVTELLNREVAPRVMPVIKAFCGREVRLVGIGSTVAILGKLAAGAAEVGFGTEGVTRLDAEQMRRTAERLWSLPLAERLEIKSIPPERADLVLTGSVIVEQIMRELGFAELTISRRGMRYGAVLDQSASATQEKRTKEGNAASNFNCPTVESFPAEPFARRVSSRVAVFSSGQLLR